MDTRSRLSDQDPRPLEPEPRGSNVHQWARAVLRHRWLLVLALLVGVPGAYVAWVSTPVTYTSQGNLMDRFVTLAGELERSKIDETVTALSEQLATAELALARAEQDLAELRVSRIGPPSDRSPPISPDLQLTRDPVFAAYFDARLELDQLSRNVDALGAILDDAPDDSDLAGALEAAEARRDEVRRRVDELEADLEAVPPSVIEEGRLVRRVQETARLYDGVRARLDRARAAAETTGPEVRILDRASVPRRPSEDLRLPMAAAILFGSFAAAIGGALLMDGLRPRLGEDLIPLLAIVVGAALAVVATWWGR